MSYGIKTWRSNQVLQTDSSTLQGGFLLLGTVDCPTALNAVAIVDYPTWAGKTVRTILVTQRPHQYAVVVTYPGGVPRVSVTSTVAGNTPAICYVFGK